MRDFSVMLYEKILVYVWCIIIPWHTVYIYHQTTLNGVVWEYGKLQWYVSEVILAFLVLVSLYQVYQDNRGVVPTRQYTMKRAVVLVALIAFPLYALVRGLFSYDVAVSSRHVLYLVEGLLMAMVVVASRVPLRTWCVAYSMGAVIPLVVGIGQFVLQQSGASSILGLSLYQASDLGVSVVASDTLGRFLRAYGTFAHPNMFGWYLVSVVGVSYLFFIMSRDKKYTLPLGVFQMIVIWGIIVTFSRSAYLCLLGILGGMVWYAWRTKDRSMIALASMSVITVLCFGTIYRDIVFVRMIPQAATEVRSITERTQGVVQAWGSIQNYRWIGVGPGLYTYTLHRDTTDIPRGYSIQPVHNVPLLLFAEYGIIGVVFVLCSVGVVVYGVARYGVYRTLLVFFVVIPVSVSTMLDHYPLTTYPSIVLFFAYCSFFIKFSTSTPHTFHKK